ncbi:DUF2065 domain-containing protein [Pokkaliibacter sp. CJK22405]|uniref:DUF2065 domain-containing protein n=1 Tax=Pokkaliibacter sp. CJK22405 TaxID=3384615 RepID=UPI003984FA72
MNNDFWQSLAIAFCLMLVMEGVLPFLSPRSWKQVMAQLVLQSDARLRLWGGLSMLTGVCLLYWVH